MEEREAEQPPQRLIFPFIALMADWDLPLPSLPLSPFPCFAWGDRIWGNMGRLFISISHHLQDSLHAQVARCMHACHAVKGKGREELIDTPPSLSLSPNLGSRLPFCLWCGTCSVSICLAIWWFVVILKVNRYPSADDGGGPIWNLAYTTFF